MVNNITNDRGATAIATIKGSGVGSRHASKRRRAALAASIIEGDAVFMPSVRQVSTLFNVCVPYINIARLLSPAQRKAIVDGTETGIFTIRLNPPEEAPLALSAPKSISDEELVAIIGAVGIDRALTAAAVVEVRAA
jgi:hypothetical protein